ncbi:MAG TPA: mechanosensitive ion channel domain-containing protein [Candidatus Competibacteraceae bacterium]|nr:mechanosensitive ion channel domain-containing protein [Candidatus Competibacteraceae bacterium]
MAQSLAVVPDPAWAREQVQLRRQTLADDLSALQRQRQELERLRQDTPAFLQNLKVEAVTQAMVEQARVDVDAISLKLDNVRIDIANTERAIKELTQSIGELEAQEQLLKNPAKETGDGADRILQLQKVSETLEQRRIELDLLKQHLDHLGQSQQLDQQRLELLRSRRARIEELYQLRQDQDRRTQQENLEQRLLQEQEERLGQLQELRRRLDSDPGLGDFQRRTLQIRIGVLDARNKLDQLDLRLSTIDNSLATLDTLVQRQDAQPRELDEGLERLQGILQELKSAQELIQRNVDVGEQQKLLLADVAQNLSASERKEANALRQLIEALLADVGERRTRMSEQQSRAEQLRGQIQQRTLELLNRSLVSRARLPADAEGWGKLLEGLASAPWVMVHQVRLSAESALKAMWEGGIWPWLLLLALEAGLLALVVAGRRGLRRSIERLHTSGEDTYFNALLLLLLNLLRKNLKGAGVAAAILLILAVFPVPQPGLYIIIALVLLWVGIKLPINLTWLLLASPELPEGQRHLALYRQLRWVLLLVASLAAVIILARLSLLADELVQVYDRLFMLSLLLGLKPGMQLRRFLLGLLSERFSGQFGFIALRIMSLLFPLTLASAALLGLVGYLNLAWTVAWHLVVFLLLLVGWLVLRGLLDDAVVWLKNYAITHSEQGLLWTQEIIAPLHRIANVLLFLGMGVVLFKAYGLEGDSGVVVAIWKFLEAPLFTLGGAEISLWRIAVTVITFMLAIWFGQWCKAVTYRWVFARITDLGVRNSLSVFTQYFVVLVGLLITLRLVGLDLTTLTVFAGAVGVGIGFGMQNIANNFISGLLLLIERPLRRGDTVQIGQNLGQISRIGIRSLTLRTFDNMDVIIPNSDVITNAFVNWTHSDNVVRTVLYIGVSYDADPHEVKRVLEKCLNGNKMILREPAPAVFLWEFAASAMNFRMQYYCDFVHGDTNAARSQLLFAVFDAFKQAGIGIPYPQQELRIKEWPASVTVMRRDEALAEARVLQPPGSGTVVPLEGKGGAQ